jgi:hypothetical protein
MIMKAYRLGDLARRDPGESKRNVMVFGLTVATKTRADTGAVSDVRPHGRYG